MYQRTARAITSSGKAWSEKALVERTVKRRPHTLHRQRWPPNRVDPSFRVRSFPHPIHVIASPFPHNPRLVIVLPISLQQNQTGSLAAGQVRADATDSVPCLSTGSRCTVSLLRRPWCVDTS